MIPPDMGPRMPCADSEAAASIRNNAVSEIELVRLFLLRTGLPCSDFACTYVAFFRGLQITCLGAALRADRRYAGDGQIHGAVDRNMGYASLFVDPAVAVELVFLIEQETTKLGTLIGLEHGRAVVLESFVHFVLGEVARNRTRISNQRTGGNHL